MRSRAAEAERDLGPLARSDHEHAPERDAWVQHGAGRAREVAVERGRVARVTAAADEAHPVRLARHGIGSGEPVREPQRGVLGRARAPPREQDRRAARSLARLGLDEELRERRVAGVRRALVQRDLGIGRDLDPTRPAARVLDTHPAEEGRRTRRGGPRRRRADTVVDALDLDRPRPEARVVALGYGAGRLAAGTPDVARVEVAEVHEQPVDVAHAVGAEADEVDALELHDAGPGGRHDGRQTGPAEQARVGDWPGEVRPSQTNGGERRERGGVHEAGGGS